MAGRTLHREKRVFWQKKNSTHMPNLESKEFIRNRIPPTVSMGMARKSSSAESGTIEDRGELWHSAAQNGATYSGSHLL